MMSSFQIKIDNVFLRVVAISSDLGYSDKTITKDS